MKDSQKNIEYVIMVVYVQLYMMRLQCSMKGMKFLKGEKCRLNYWKRFLEKVRHKGFFPMWEDFNEYLIRLPHTRPNISKQEFDDILYEVSEFQESETLNELSLSNVLMEIAFNDYMQMSFKGFRYLSEDQQAFRISSFWNRIAWIYLVCKEPFEYSQCEKLIDRFEFPEVLKIDKKIFDQVKRETAKHFIEFDQ